MLSGCQAFRKMRQTMRGDEEINQYYFRDKGSWACGWAGEFVQDLRTMTFDFNLINT